MLVNGEGLSTIGANDFVDTVTELKASILNTDDRISQRTKATIHIRNVRHDSFLSTPSAPQDTVT